MEIGKRLNPRYIFVGLYFFAFLIYIVVGLQPAEATNYQISGELVIPKINLDSSVTSLKMEGHELKTPDTIVGSYSSAENKILLIGHSSTVFDDLDQLEVSDEIIYDDHKFVISKKETVKKEEVVMPELLEASKKETIVIMTCAGEGLDNGDATHRLIITAEKV